MTASRLEQAVADVYQGQPTMKQEVMKGDLEAHQTSTKALCPHCGTRPVDWLMRRGKAGAYHTSCSGCYGQVVGQI
jgi:formate dehydrogenase maturation protein FdhE